MTTKQAMAILRVSENTILQMARQGRFCARKKRDGGWVIQRLPFDRPTILPDEVAALLRVSGRFIRKLCKQRRLKARKIGRQWRIDWVDGLLFIKARGNFK
jgi:excisionase family DNA binding protein